MKPRIYKESQCDYGCCGHWIYEDLGGITFCKSFEDAWESAEYHVYMRSQL